MSDMKISFPISFALVVTVAKIFFSYYMYGTNDITYWMYFARVIKESGTFEIYHLVEIYNHPPLISWVLKFIPWLMSMTSLSFPFLFRLLPIFADFGTLLVVWKLMCHYGIKNRDWVFVSCAISPTHFLISGFHGNTDPVFIFFLWLAVYFYETGRKSCAAWVYGLSLCIKIVPILALPAFLFRSRSLKEASYFLGLSALIPAVVFLPYFFHDPSAIIKNIFGYGGLHGIWGLGRMLQTVDPLLYKTHITYGLLVYFIGLGLLLYWLRKKNGHLVEGIFLTYCLFLVWTSGFGVQYLSWVCLWAIVSLPVVGTLYSILSGFFLYRVYTFWSGGFPMYYANSDKVGQWIGQDKVLDLVIWFLVAAMLALYVNRMRIRRHG